jgi:hypothetical protein
MRTTGDDDGVARARIACAPRGEYRPASCLLRQLARGLIQEVRELVRKIATAAKAAGECTQPVCDLAPERYVRLRSSAGARWCQRGASHASFSRNPSADDRWVTAGGTGVSAPLSRGFPIE